MIRNYFFNCLSDTGKFCSALGSKLQSISNSKLGIENTEAVYDIEIQYHNEPNHVAEMTTYFLSNTDVVPSLDIDSQTEKEIVDVMEFINTTRGDYRKITPEWIRYRWLTQQVINLSCLCSKLRLYEVLPTLKYLANECNEKIWY